MAIRIVPHAEDKRVLVEEFNRRMLEGGSSFGFYADPAPCWIPKREGQKVWREFYVAIERDAVVGGFALKPQEWLIHGAARTVADWQGPFSLGAIDNRYAALGLRMLRDMETRQPLLYSWGHGGSDEPILQLLRKMGWLMIETPFLFRVVHPRNFLRKNAYLREEKGKALLQDVLAVTGLGSIGLRALHWALRARSRRRFRAEAERVPSFGAWADDVWQRAKWRYDAIAVRDAETMNALAPREHRTNEWPPPVRLRVRKDGMDLGWALIVERQLEGHSRFGDMRVGMIADYLAVPERAGEIVHAAFSYLRASGVDLAFANQAHPAWIAAFVDNGFVCVPKRRVFCASPGLERALTPIERTRRGLLVSNMDGHGPML